MFLEFHNMIYEFRNMFWKNDHERESHQTILYISQFDNTSKVVDRPNTHRNRGEGLGNGEKVSRTPWKVSRVPKLMRIEKESWEHLRGGWGGG